MSSILKSSYPDLTALLLRLSFGIFLLAGHGVGKLNMLISGNIQFPALFGFSPTLNLVLSTFAELFCAALVTLGLKTRMACIPVIINMSVAAFVVHSKHALFIVNAAGKGSKELALIYLTGFVAIFSIRLRTGCTG